MAADRGTVRDWKHAGFEIRLARRALGMSQQDLADRIGIDRRTIGNYEAGRPPAGDRIPDGYYDVARALGWARHSVEDVLAGQAPTAAAEDPGSTAPTPPAEPAVDTVPFRGGSAADLFPAVGRFARAAVAAGGDPALRDLLEDVADRLLQSIPREAQARQAPYGLAAYRPHGWVEGDPGVPADDAARIQQAIEEFERGKNRE